jgi:hypothetical protein
MNMNTVVNQNVVPSNAHRKAMLPSGVLFRFGFEPIPGSGLSKVGEVVFPTVPPVETLKGLQQEYCRVHNIDEPFNSANYGYGDTAE